MPHAHSHDAVRADALAAVAPELRYLSILDEAWRTAGIGRRHDAVRAAAPSLRAHLVDGPRVVAVHALDLTRAPYATKFAFRGAALSIAPYVVLTHRCLVVQLMQQGALKTLLFNPTDVAGARRTPYFAKIAATTPRFVEELLAPPCPTIESQLAALGLSVDDVDYVAFDHFHVQDLRPIIGTKDRSIAARFPHAKLLAPRIEWDDWGSLHPLQRAFFVAGGRDGVDESRIVFTEGDLVIGDGVVLARTPGHTSGNQTLFFHAPSHDGAGGVWGVSENGVCADSYAPIDSHIAGLRRYARHVEVDLIPNLNTPESGADQYTSMTLERMVVDRVARAPAFVQMWPSSEVTPTPLAPGLSPTVRFGPISFGSIVSSKRAPQPPFAHASA